ncbi:MAG: thymidine phosphorylase [Candidatus Cloacimonetes bacterium]|nr:thymidine phosphorylase [Candidatus Cloacimonadota bacterium]
MVTEELTSNEANPVEIILKKRNKQELTTDEISSFIGDYIADKIPEYQMSALLMAIFLNGMTPTEIQALSKVYVDSGDRITFPENWRTVDKHSTGGVGDKITLMLAPIIAACGAKIPMISGRGLGHTGGTLDKLEAIPCLCTNFPKAKFCEFIEDNGFAIISQSDKLVPADKRIYALRDVSATVESLPLITASIMSKKIAEGAQGLVIDLKVGTGAFMKTLEQAEQLAKLLQETGREFGMKVSVVFTDMNSPIGKYIGNALEVQETIEYLSGEAIEDVHELTMTLAGEMLVLAGKAESLQTGIALAEKARDNGDALEKFRRFIELQGGNPAVCDDVSLLPQAKYKIPITSLKSGYISTIDSQRIGYALVRVDAGRKQLDSILDYSSGAYLPFKIGDKIEAGASLGTVYCNNAESGKIVSTEIAQCFTVSVEPVKKTGRIIRII